MKKRIAFLAPLLFAILPGLAEAKEAAGLMVRVVDRAGQPVSRAVVHAGMQLEEIEDPERPTWQETTAADGTARLAGLPADEVVWLLIERKGFFPELRNLKPGTGEPREVRVALRPGGVAVGRVIDEAGRPVAGAEVEIEGSPFHLWTDLFPAFVRDLGRQRVRTGPAGRFRVRDLPEGEYGLRIEHPSHAPLVADRPIQGGQGGDLGRFVLRRGRALTGTVTDSEGRPIAGLPLWAVTDLTEEEGTPPPSVTTGADGTFVIPHLPPGELDLHVCGPGYLQQWISVPFLDEPVHLTLEPAATLRGRVLDPEGRPREGVYLSADQSGLITLSCGSLWTPCAPDSSASTDAEGRFEVGPLAPGWYDLRAEADGLAGFVAKLRAPAGETVEGIEIRLQPEPGEEGEDSSPGKRELLPVRGRVIGPEGSPIERALVIAVYGTQTWSLADGSFDLRLPPGEIIEIGVSKPGFAALSSTVDTADLPPGGIELRLERGATVTGRVLGLTAAEREQRIEIQLDGEDNERLYSSLRSDGTFQIDHVVPGAWILVVTGSRTAQTALVVQPGQAEVSVDVEMAPTYAVTGQVLDELARPIGGAVVHGSNEDGMVAFWESTRMDGTFALQLPDGHFDIEVDKKGFHKAERELRVDGGPVAGLEVRLTLSTTLRGRLFGLAPGETPTILAKGPEDNPMGEVGLDCYSIIGLGPGTWTIEATVLDVDDPERGEKRVLRQTLEIPAGGMDLELDLDFAKAETVAAEEEP